MKAEYDGEQINIYNDEGGLEYEIPIRHLINHNVECLYEFGDIFGAAFNESGTSEALAELFDEKGDEIQKHIDYIKNYYNV
jgi:hypothetical protein